MASLTPAALVSRLEEDMRSGSIPPLGLQMSMDNGLELLAAGMQPYTDPNVEVLMVGAPGVVASFQGIDGLFAAWRDWGKSFQALDVVFDELAQVPAGALLLVPGQPQREPHPTRRVDGLDTRVTASAAGSG